MDAAGSGTAVRGRRSGLWIAAAAAVLTLVAGVCVAVLGYSATTGPEGAVRGYYAALERGDAPAALGYGAVPKGPHALLTSAVLAEQQRIAPISGFDVVQTWRTASRATVRVTYALGFAHDRQQVHDTVHVRLRDGVWRLTRVAVRTQLFLTAARQRASILGASIPRGYVLLFPGAVPIRFDSPYLRLAASAGSVAFGALPTTRIRAAVTERGRQAARAAVTRAVQRCLSGAGADPSCPQPPGRYVPGSLRGTVLGAFGDQLGVGLEPSRVGVLDVTGHAQVRLHYRKLTFRNREVAGAGRFSLPLHARAYAVPPLRIAWGHA